MPDEVRSGSKLVNRLQKVWSRIEDFSWAIVASLCGGIGLILALPLTFSGLPATLMDGVIRYCVVAALLFFNVLLFRALNRAFRQRPYAPHVAMAMPVFPVALRPFAALFWIAHLFVTLSLVWRTHMTPPELPLWGRVLLGGLGALCSFWAFGYLLLAIVAIKRSPSVVAVVWRYRTWYLILIVGASFALPYFGLMDRTSNATLILPQSVTVASQTGIAEIEVRVINGVESENEILGEVTWDDFSVTIHTAGAPSLRKPAEVSRQVLRSGDSDYRRLAPKETARIGCLRVGTRAPIGRASQWVDSSGNVSPSGPTFGKPGKYHLVLRYEDRNGPNRNAVSSMADAMCTVIVE